ncbi:MAG: IclR family transcriptional regulator [Pseudomonadota bacterium]|nr:IclR family transcriptional regulator [Pseudomonadota bacterium]
MTTSDKLLSVLKLFTLEAPNWSVAEAAQSLDLPLSTTYRFFRSLAKAGLISGFENGRYLLGPTISRLDRQLRLTDPLLNAARPKLQRIARARPGRVIAFICRLFGTEVICVHQEYDDSRPFAIGYERGRPMSLYRGSASKVVLAHLPPRQLRVLYERAPAEFAAAELGISWKEAKLSLQAIRTAGHCVTTGDVDPGMRGVSVALFSHERKIIGSLNVAGRRGAIPDGSLKTILRDLRSAASQIERRLHRHAAGNSARHLR